MVLTRAQRRIAEQSSVIASVQCPSSSCLQNCHSPPSTIATHPLPSEEAKDAIPIDQTIELRSASRTSRKRTSSSNPNPRPRKRKPKEQVFPPGPRPIHLSATLLTLIATKLTVTNLFWTNNDVFSFLQTIRKVPTQTLQFLALQMLRFLSVSAQCVGLSINKFLAREERSRMYAATAIKEYGVSEKYLKDLTCQRVPNPHYKNAAPSRLFDRKTIRAVARRNHLSYDLFKLKKTRRAQKRAENALIRPPIRVRREQNLVSILEKYELPLDCCFYSNHHNEYINRGRGDPEHIAKVIKEEYERQDTLTIELSKFGLTLRHDSRLCEAFVTQCEGDPEEIAKIMNEMNFYHTHTRYRTFYHNHKEYQRENYRWYDPDEVSSSAKLSAVQDWCSRFETVEEALADSTLPQSLHTLIVTEFPRNRRTLIQR
ncbi:hypothetical protein RCL1_000296 [Eukaryota sp. TZLM3-RCL]